MATKSGIKKAIVPFATLPPVSIFKDGTIGHYVRYRITSEDRNKTSHWSPVYMVRIPEFSYLGEVKVAVTSDTITATWGDEYNRPRYDIYVKWGNRLQSANVSGTVATIVTHADHGFSDGDTVEIVGTGQTFLDNKIFTITTIPLEPKKFNINIEIGVGSGNYPFSSVAEAKTLYLYHGTSPIHTYSLLRLANFDIIHVDIQVESIEKVYSESLLIYDSPAIALT